MSDQFDPYYTWLGIPPEEQPADYYRLLGIRKLESNIEVISNAVDQRMSHIRSFQTGKRSGHSQEVLNVLSRASVQLLNPEKKEAYDRELRAKVAPPAAASSKPAPAPAPVAKRPAPASGSSSSPDIKVAERVAPQTAPAPARPVAPATFLSAASLAPQGSISKVAMSPSTAVNAAEIWLPASLSARASWKSAYRDAGLSRSSRASASNLSASAALSAGFVALAKSCLNNVRNSGVETPLTTDARRELAHTAFGHIDLALIEGKFDEADEAARQAVAGAAKTTDGKLKTLAKSVQTGIETCKQLAESAALAAERLKSEPDNTKANLTLGKYVCFVKRDWKTGLAHLAKGDDEALQRAAALELAQPAAADQQVATADAWFDAAKTAARFEKMALERRARQWYAKSLPNLGGVSKVRIQQRLTELEATLPPDSSDPFSS